MTLLFLGLCESSFQSRRSLTAFTDAILSHTAYRYPSNTGLLTAGGSFGIIAALYVSLISRFALLGARLTSPLHNSVCWYAALASLLTEESSLFRLPVLGNFSKKQHSA